MERSPAARKSEWSPKAVWDRVQRKVKGWMDDEEAQADDASIAFLLAFIAPLLVAYVILLRR
jgi:hypothetical protein